jgi:hypothetical protein
MNPADREIIPRQVCWRQGTVAFSPFPPSSAHHVRLKGIPMAKLRSFVSTYSPMLAVSAAIIGLYAMAICIGCGLSLPI